MVSTAPTSAATRPRPRARCRTPSASGERDDREGEAVEQHARPGRVVDRRPGVVVRTRRSCCRGGRPTGVVASRTATVAADAARAAATTRSRPRGPVDRRCRRRCGTGEVVVMRASRWAVVGRWLDARKRRPGPADRGGLGDRVPCWHGAAGAAAVPTVLTCRGPAAPPWRARCWLPCHWSSRSASWPPRPPARRGSPSRSASLVVPATTALSVLVARRRDGAVVGLLLGLLSLAVAARRRQGGLAAVAGDHRRPRTSGRGWSRSPPRTRGGSSRRSACCCCTSPTAGCRRRAGAGCRRALVAARVVTQVDGAVGRRAVPGAARGPRPPVRPAAALVEVLALVAFFVMLVLVVACAVSLVLRFRRGRRRPAPADQVAGPGRDRDAALPAALPARDPGLGRAAVVQRGGRPRRAGRHPGRGGASRCCATTCTTSTRRSRSRSPGGWSPPLLLARVRRGLLGRPGCWSAATPQVGVAVGTAAAALLLLPALRAVRRAVDARMYPLRRAALAAVDELHREVSAGRARPEQLQEVLREALRDPGLRVGLPGARVGRLPRRRRPDRCPADGVPVLLDDEQTGVLVRGSGPASAELLREVADRCTHAGRGGPAALRGGAGAARGRVQPDPAARDRLRGAPPDGARPARRRPAAAGLPRHAAAAGPAPPRRRHRRRRRAARRERRRARHRRRRAAPDRARAAAEQPRRRPARRAVEPGPQPAR